MHKTLSRLLIEISIVCGMLSITIGIAMKLFNAASIYTPQFLGLTPTDFLQFGAVCFLFAVALTGRRILKHLEYAVQERNRANGLG